MKKVYGKSAVIVLTLIMVLSLFAGCGNKEAGKQADSETKTPAESFDYKIDRMDFSKSESNNGFTLDSKQYYELVVINDRGEAADKVNEDLNNGLEDFKKRFKDTEEYFNDALENLSCNDEFTNTVSTEVKQNENDIFSVIYIKEWYQGGVFNGDYSGAAYRISTGDRLNLAEALGISEEEAMKRVVNTVDAEIAKAPERFEETAHETVKNRKIDEISFYMEKGDAYICFSTYELACGAEGSFIFKLTDGDNSSGTGVENDTAEAGQTSSAEVCYGELIGKSVKDIRAALGENYSADYYEGGFGIIYEMPPVMYIVDSTGTVSELNDNLKASMLISGDDGYIIENLSAKMTFPEIENALSKKIKLSEPEFVYNEMDDVNMYVLEFDYSGYHFYYMWADNPTKNKSYQAWVSLK